MAQTMLAGYAPWRLAYNMKLPGTDTMYAVFMAVFGQTAVAIRLGLLLVNTATIFLTVLLGKRLFGRAGGLIAGASYAILSCSQGVLGTMAHATHYVVFFALLAILLLLRADGRMRRLFLSGLVFGLAFLMKQPGIFFGAFGTVYLIWRWKTAGRSVAGGVKELGIFLTGLALPYCLVCFALWRAGVFSRFWFWTFTLARAYATQFPFSARKELFQLIFPGVVGPNLFFMDTRGISAGGGMLESGDSESRAFCCRISVVFDAICFRRRGL